MEQFVEDRWARLGATDEFRPGRCTPASSKGSSSSSAAEYDALAGWPDRERPVLALVRFLASPVVERRVHAAARIAIRWVSEGRLLRKLTQ